MLIVVAIAAALASASVGGGLYEFSVVDPLLIAALVWSWSQPAVRSGLLVALSSHAVMRLWSAFDFIPKALAFEKAGPEAFDEAAARAWTARSRWRLPLDLVTVTATFSALLAAARPS